MWMRRVPAPYAAAFTNPQLGSFSYYRPVTMLVTAVTDLWRLVGHFHPVLQNVHWELGGGVRGYPQPEVLRSSCWVYLLTHLVQHWHPTWSQVAILQKQPTLNALTGRTAQIRTSLPEKATGSRQAPMSTLPSIVVLTSMLKRQVVLANQYSITSNNILLCLTSHCIAVHPRQHGTVQYNTRDCSTCSSTLSCIV